MWLLLFTLLHVARGDYGRCPGTTHDYCKCQYTDPGIFCPKGYYCPSFTASQIQSIASVIASDNCILEGDTYLKCPCTPGFYCPENSSEPVYCCEGYFCETPEVIEECPEGSFCRTGFVEGLECGSGSDCPAGSTHSSRRGAVILMIFIIAILYLIFLLKYFIEARVAEAEEAMITFEQAQQQSDLEEANIQSNPISSSIESMKFDIGENSSKKDIVKTTQEGLLDSFHIQFDNITLTLQTGVTIMKGVTGEFKPGRMCAIMGPSGAGKTTIISLITGKAIKTDGTITVNGQQVNDLSKWRKLIGFVPQEDIMIRQLSVRANIEFSANYRLPVEFTEKERNDVVNKTLVSLGISHVQHSIIGDERERGISGGQRKRVNIGIELVSLPKVLFLDEPTSGLDSTSSATLCQQLKGIARSQGVTIASVIHQPSIQAFLEFDDLLLLGKGGEVVYHGEVSKAMAYFERIGFHPPQLTNPADFYLDIANGAVPRDGYPDFKPVDLFGIWHQNSSRKSSVMSQLDDRRMTIGAPLHREMLYETLNPVSSLKAFKGAIVHLLLTIKMWFVDKFLDIKQVVGSVFVCNNGEIRNTPGFMFQFYACMVRAFKQKYRRYGAFAGQMFIHLATGLVVSSVADDLQYVGPLPNVVCSLVTEELQGQCFIPLTDSYQQTGNFLNFGIIFSAMSISTAVFGDEQVNYWRETAAGLNGPAYFFAKWIVEIPNIVLASAFFFLAFSVNFPSTTNGAQMFTYFFAFYWWAWSLGFVLSMIAPPKYVFLTGVLSALLFAIAFSGTNPTLIDVRDMSPAITWIWSISGPRWGLEAFYVSQLKYYETVPSGPLEDEPYMNVKAGLDQFGYNLDNFTYNINNLFWNGLGYALFALFVMTFTNTEKKK